MRTRSRPPCPTLTWRRRWSASRSRSWRSAARSQDFVARLEREGSAAREVQYGDACFAQNISTILDAEGKYVGMVCEWRDRTGEIRVEQEVARVVAAASAGDLAGRTDTGDRPGFL